MLVDKRLRPSNSISAMVIGSLVFVSSAFGQNPPGNTGLDLVPIGSTGPVISLVGNSIEIPAGGGVVELELRVSGWAATGDGLILAVQATIDGTGYCSGVGAPLNPLGYPRRVSLFRRGRNPHS